MDIIPVQEEHVNERIDVFAARLMPALSRASVQKLCEQDKILVNDKPVRSSYKLRPHDRVVFDYDHDSHKRQPDIDLPVLYEDDDCMVINKPAGVLTHSKGVFNPEGTVATFIRSRLTGLDGERAGIVHRLDRGTSGIIICAKHPGAQAWLQKQFSQRKVKKRYLAVVKGHPKPETAVIDMPIERNPKKPQTFRAGKMGKPAVTSYTILDRSARYSLLACQPLTGRTHQLRVHLKRIGYPIVGDHLYGGETAERLMLHAESLEVTLPNRKRTTFTTDMPHSFRSYITDS
jgi:23S rRNA pseudouridine1911/1915/1917 synthase